DEQREKHPHRGEADHADRVERDGPREEKCDLEIEDDEEDRNEVVAHIEAVARVLERLEAALVGRQLFRILSASAQGEPDEQQHRSQHAGLAQKDQDRKVVCKHTFALQRRTAARSGDKKIGRWTIGRLRKRSAPPISRRELYQLGRGESRNRW